MDESLKSKEFIYAKKYAKTIEQWILGKESPKTWLKVVFFINLAIGLILLLWHVMSLYALNTSDLILEKKGIDIIRLLENHALAIGLNPEGIIERLIYFQYASISIWSIFLIGLIFLWRRKGFSFWIHGFCILAYYGTIIFFFNLKFFNLDIRIADKIMLGIVIISLGIAYLILYLNRVESTTSVSEEKEDLNSEYFEIEE